MKRLAVLVLVALAGWSTTPFALAAPPRTEVLFEVAPDALHDLRLKLIDAYPRTYGEGTHRATLVLAVFPQAAAEAGVLKMEIDVWGPNGDFLGRVWRSPVVHFSPGDFSIESLFFDSTILPAFQPGSRLVFRVVSGFLVPARAAEDPWFDGYEPRCPGGFIDPDLRCDAIEGFLREQLCDGRPLEYFYCRAAFLHPLARDCHYPDIFADWNQGCR